MTHTKSGGTFSTKKKKKKKRRSFGFAPVLNHIVSTTLSGQ